MGIVQAIVDVITWPALWQLVVFGLTVPLGLVVAILWIERKMTARVQRRIGPLHVSPQIGGALQLVADLFRYMFQEIIVPKTADRGVFLLAPLTALILSVLPIVAIPLTSNPQYWPVPMDYSMLVALALLTVSPIFLILAGWASNNKFSIIGGIREAFMITAYELVTILAFLSATAMTGSYNLAEIVAVQQETLYFALLNPPAFIAAFIATLMATSGFPFEIPESENEVVAGPFTEYSGLLYGMNMGAAYLKRFIYSVLIAIVFLGGWSPVTPGEGFIYGYLLPAAVGIVKATILMVIFSFFRSVYGRYRLDQALHLAWKILFPLALAGLGLGLVEAYLGIVG